MTQYASLKDYIAINNMDIIYGGLNNYIKGISNCHDYKMAENGITIKTLAWDRFDSVSSSEGYLTFTIGISAKLINIQNKSIMLRHYNITMRGNIRKQLADLEINSINEVTESLIQKESVFSLFGLPTNITADTLEEIAENFYSAYCPEELVDKNRRYSLPVLNIKKQIGISMWYAKLPDDCLGRMYLRPSVADIYDTTTSMIPISYPDEPIPFGTILLNYAYYRTGDRTDDVIVSATEFIHWHYHQAFMDIISILDNERIAINCSSEPLLPDDKMPVAEKAYWYAEWQANELSIRVAMPKHLVEDAIAEYEENNIDCPHDGMYYQNMIYRLSWDFNVPIEIMKKRLRQLGYYLADGTFVTVDDCLYQPFIFVQGALEENETFVINRSNYEILLREDKGFAELIDSGKYIYLGYVVCLLDSKYVNFNICEDSINFQLTDYAREHTDECCLKFAIHSVVDLGNKYIHCGQTYLSKDDKELIQEYEAVIPVELKKDINNFIQEELAQENLHTFGDTLSYYLFENKSKEPIQVRTDNGNFSQEAGEIIKDFSTNISMSDTIIKKYLNNVSRPKLETTMRICVELNLNETQSRDIIKKAGHYLDSPCPENKVCRLIFRLSSENSLEILNNWSTFVEYFNQI
ncbi:MAG: hypothetical protein ACI4Q5_10170 [Porcipelethomonas sp.]